MDEIEDTSYGPTEAFVNVETIRGHRLYTITYIPPIFDTASGAPLVTDRRSHTTALRDLDATIRMLRKIRRRLYEL